MGTEELAWKHMQARTQGGGGEWAIAPPLGLMLKKKIHGKNT